MIFRRRRHPSPSRSTAWPAQAPSGVRGIESLATGPWMEALMGIVVGLIFLLAGKRELAELTWVIGAALSVTRYAFARKLEDEMDPVHKLAAVVDLQREVSLAQFQEMIRVYLEVTEPEFRRVKDTVVTEAIDRLLRLARQKTSDELAMGDYYNWLFPILELAPSGSTVWAISTMLTAEWDDSAAERTFLRLNLEAADRGVLVERIFIVPKANITQLGGNHAIREQIRHAGEFLHPLLVEREHLEQRDPRLLQEVGDGLIAFDTRVALIDVSSPNGAARGYVTMKHDEIARLRRLFENLCVHADPMGDVVTVPDDHEDGNANPAR